MPSVPETARARAERAERPPGAGIAAIATALPDRVGRQRRDRRPPRRRRRLDRLPHRDPRAPPRRAEARPLAELAADGRRRARSTRRDRAGGRRPDPGRDLDRRRPASRTPRRWSPSGSAPRRAGAIDVGAACTGFVSALELRPPAIESGRADTVLVIGAELMSRVARPRRPAHRRPVRRRRRRRGRRPRRHGRDRADPAARRRRRLRALVTASHDGEQGPHGRPRDLPRRRRPPRPRSPSRSSPSAGLTLDDDRPVRLPPGQRPHPLAPSASASGCRRSGSSTRIARTATPRRRASRSRSTRRCATGGCADGSTRLARRLRRRADLGRRRSSSGGELMAADRVGEREPSEPRGHLRAPPAGGCALVTGASRGIGAAIARRARRRRLAGGDQLPHRPRRRRAGRRRRSARPAGTAIAVARRRQRPRRRRGAVRRGRGRARPGARCWSTTPA